jgi:putative flippase GtrA
MSHITLKLGTFLKQTNSFTKFLFVGVLNTVIGLSTMFLLFNIIGTSYWLSTFIGNGIGALASFLLNRKFTFNSDVHFSKGAPKFLAVILTCYFLSYSISDSFTKVIFEDFGISSVLGQGELAILLGSVIYTLSNYFGQKYMVFRN